MEPRPGTRDRPVGTVVLFGPTAVGKGAVARALARLLGAEVVSMDSMKVYRRMDVGTAKPPPEARAGIPHHLLDVADPWEVYSAGRFHADAARALGAIGSRGRTALLCGGTGLYLRVLERGLFAGPGRDARVRDALLAEGAAVGAPALHERLLAADPAVAARLHPNDLRRIVRGLEVLAVTGKPLSAWQAEARPLLSPDAPVVVLARDDEDLRRRIALRLERMVAAGFLAEVERLLAEPRGLAPEPAAAVGYRELSEHLRGRTDLPGALDAIRRRTWQFTRRQRIWSRSVPRRVEVPVPPDEPPEATAERILAVVRPARP
ncbi:MAG: tRNA (adenosine(37)-N6)-dimethylallyltransferase MiaA [Planctomycetales bacterium]|nr:tRNA (adenosine(37)-N6)-dimethylallyltransferase MiaA [Planctomycetales bacterium]